MKSQVAFSIALVFLGTLSALGAVPQQINYQGYLTDTGGNALDTTVAMTFKLYTDSTAGNLLWTETRPSVTVADGLFNVRLGQLTALGDNVFNNAQVWLGITVGNNSEMIPRGRIVSVGYSYRVGTVDGASGGTITGDVSILGKGNIGTGNVNNGVGAFVVGTYDTASGDYSTVGGLQSRATGDLSTVSGGVVNKASDWCATVSGGMENAAEGDFATVSGGCLNEASAGSATVGGGQSNTASGGGATVGGGLGNTASGENAAVGGGKYNRARGLYSVVAGGGGLSAVDSNSALGNYSTIAGGRQNSATAHYSTVCGGYLNEASGFYSTIAGGSNSQVDGIRSFVCGTNATMHGDSSFIFSDGRYQGPSGQGTTCRFIVIASNGTSIYSSADLSSGVRLNAGSNSWTSISDSTKKRNIRLVDTKDVLSRVAALPIKQWSYKSQDPSIEHIGPMAQDFWKQFHLGEDSLGISTIDPAGIALAAIQELNKKVQEIDALTTENSKLQAQNSTLEKRVAKIELQLQQLCGQGSKFAKQASFSQTTH